MTPEQLTISVILVTAVGLFVWGRWRHDMVALAALIAAVLAGLIAPDRAFSGFAHPAVITVACILVLSRGLQNAGVFDLLVQRFIPASAGPAATVALMTTLGAIPSAFMNNVGALALLMPVALQLAGQHKLPPGRLLMPLAFGSILGGMTTLIGTPPNLIVSSFRASQAGAGFAMFDFAPVGLSVAICGVIFTAILGWRLVPDRRGSETEPFNINDYLTEARAPKGSKAVGLTLRQVEELLEKVDAQVIGLIRNDVRFAAPVPTRKVKAEDILVLETDPKAMPMALATLGLTLAEAVEPKNEERGKEKTPEEAKDEATARTANDKAPSKPSDEPDDIVLLELAVMPDSGLLGRSASGIRLRTSFGINLLAISRQGRRSMARLRSMQIQAGDVLLMQGTLDSIAEFAAAMGCVPLAERPLRLPDRRNAIIASLIMLAAVAAPALGLVPAAISFVGGVLATMAFRTVPLRKVYDAIDWPLIVLLGALIPVADAMATTGTADLIARGLLDFVARGNVIVALAVILVVSMTLSDFMNNAATAAVMCPIAVGTATQLGVGGDPFLMAVAIGASCAFLTPIGHQNNLLIMGPGGFRFGDYWRLGLPLELIVIAVAIPALLFFWPV